MNILEMSATALSACIQTRQLSAKEVVTAFISRIRALEPALCAFRFFDEECLLQQAKVLDSALAKGETSGILAGVPVGIKDNICTVGTPTTAGSRMLAGFVPPYNATVVEKLQQAGALLAGKMNMDEFAMGTTGENTPFAPARNPWDANRVPGGSSGGSAVAVAAGMLPCALGSDTGGSVRQPAAFCGVVGLRPTYGAVSRYGLLATASSLDQIGPLARSVQDAALLFAAIAGLDERDSTTAKNLTGRSFCLDRFLSPTGMNETDIKGLKIGIPAPGEFPPPDNDVARCTEKAVSLLEKEGAEVLEIRMPGAQHALAAYTILSTAQISSNLARYDGLKYGFSSNEAGDWEDRVCRARSEGFGPEVQRRILLGAFVLCGEQYQYFSSRALAVQRQIRQAFSLAFQRCDVITMPTTPVAAFPFGEKTGAGMYSADAYTVPATLAGLPAISVPCGLTAQGLPVGLQLVGPAFSEEKLLSVAQLYEMRTGGFPMPEVQHAL